MWTWRDVNSCHLACDLGAESGRVMLGVLSNNVLTVEELHRFPNTPIQLERELHWNIPALFDGIKTGLAKAAARHLPIASIGTDSWGVDYMLFDDRDNIIPPTFHYRDQRCAHGVKQAYAKTSWQTIFAETGIQFMPINTLFQLAAEPPERLAAARRWLNIGDGFNFLLSGVPRAEQSLASTSQLYNPRSQRWSQTLIQALNLPPDIFPVIVPSGTPLGPLRPELAQETGLTAAHVIATCSHDTGAAVAAVPAFPADPGDNTGPDWAYLSSGTWSLMGVESREVIITDACRDSGFTNEVGCGGTVRLLKNIIGLWLVQECRRYWAQAGAHYDYAALTRLAETAPPFVSLINPADPRFVSPGGMPEKIAGFCRETQQPVPGDPGAFIRCVLESLALFYRHTLRQLEQLTGRNIRRLHVVGGGSRNELLNQFIANALNIPAVAGPAEASATGNLLIQAIALGHLPSLEAAREVVRRSNTTRTFQPQPDQHWPKAYGRMEKFYK